MHLAQHYYLQLVHHKNKLLLLDLVLVLWLHQSIVTLTIIISHTITMVIDIIMVGIIVVDIITIMDVDIEMDTTIIVDIDTITDVVIGQKWDDMDIIRIENSTITVPDIINKVIHATNRQTGLAGTKAILKIEATHKTEVMSKEATRKIIEAIHQERETQHKTEVIMEIDPVEEVQTMAEADHLAAGVARQVWVDHQDTDSKIFLTHIPFLL